MEKFRDVHTINLFSEPEIPKQDSPSVSLTNPSERLNKRTKTGKTIGDFDIKDYPELMSECPQCQTEVQYGNCSACLRKKMGTPFFDVNILGSHAWFENERSKLSRKKTFKKPTHK